MKYIEIVPRDNFEDCSNVTDVKCEPLGVKVGVVYSFYFIYLCLITCTFGAIESVLACYGTIEIIIIILILNFLYFCNYYYYYYYCLCCNFISFVIVCSMHWYVMVYCALYVIHWKYSYHLPLANNIWAWWESGGWQGTICVLLTCHICHTLCDFHIRCNHLSCCDLLSSTSTSSSPYVPVSLYRHVTGQCARPRGSARRKTASSLILRGHF